MVWDLKKQRGWITRLVYSFCNVQRDSQELTFSLTLLGRLCPLVQGWKRAFSEGAKLYTCGDKSAQRGLFLVSTNVLCSYASLEIYMNLIRWSGWVGFPLFSVACEIPPQLHCSFSMLRRIPSNERDTIYPFFFSKIFGLFPVLWRWHVFSS